MAALHTFFHALWVILTVVEAIPSPGRIPKVYNALISSNQNLEPSKAYPVYQPVLHDPFVFPFQPTIFSAPGFPNIYSPPKEITAPESPPASASENVPDVKSPSTEEPTSSQPPAPSNSEGNKPTSEAPLPPNTESPIPLNQFGLPPQVLPLGRIDPAYEGFSQVAPFAYNYPGLRFYDPYDPFSYNPYLNLPPLYRPLPNSLSQGSLISAKASPAFSEPTATNSEQSASSPPPEPDNLNVLNYASKDPAIPNVPPPPLPQGGLKSDS